MTGRKLNKIWTLMIQFGEIRGFSLSQVGNFSQDPQYSAI